jgi:hypothetical protein
MWTGKLQKLYNGFEEFERYAKIYNNHLRLGFKTISGAWKSNPMIQGSTNPADYKRVKTRGRIRP